MLGCKRILISLFFFIISISLHAQDAKDSLSVLSWNIQMLPTKWAMFSDALRKKQKVRTPWIIAYAKASPYDVIVFQEVFDNRIRRKLQRGLKEIYPYMVKPLKKGNRLTNSGVLIVSKYPVKKEGQVVYPRGIYSDKMAAKGFTLVKVFKARKAIYLGGTHLQAGNTAVAAEQRKKEFAAMAKLIKEHKTALLPVIVVGDMNTQKRRTDRYQFMLNTLCMEDVVPLGNAPYTISGQNTWNNHERDIQLDYILLDKNGVDIKTEGAHLIRPVGTHKGAQVDYADHYGIGATFYW